MFITGQQVVCIDDKFPAVAAKYYDELPKKGKTYTVRGLAPGIDWNGHDAGLCVYLRELTNPRSNKPPHRERGFNPDRFRPLEELTEEEIRALVKENPKELVHVTKH